MTFRTVYTGNSMPLSYPVDVTSEFEGGQVGQLTLHGNSIVCGVSDGTAPLGIIDDIKTRAFYAPAIDEQKIIPVMAIDGPGGKKIVATDTLITLENPNIMQNSFVCDIDVFLKERNGVIVIPQGTELNYDSNGDHIPDSVRLVCSYNYQVPNIPGDDSTIGSKRVTIWFQRMIFQTDKFEVSQRYPLNHNLFVNEKGMLTTRQITQYHPPVAIVTGPPTPRMQTLEAMWL